jgi:SAM-dependent methyltransferase
MIKQIYRKLRKIKNNYNLIRIEKDKKDKLIKEEFKGIRSYAGIQKLLENFEFNTVLDIGCGDGQHSDLFLKYNKTVTAIDYGKSKYFEKNKSKIETIIANYSYHNFEKKFDCIWASHVLEHTPNPHEFLIKIHEDLKEGGVLAITVPPLKMQIVAGHINLFNPGLLIYRIILAGFDCSEASLLEYEYNITIIVKKKSINIENILNYDSGDIKSLKKYFPIHVQEKIGSKDNFDGRIGKINW